MTITADSQIDEPAPPMAHRRRLGLWITLGVVLALVVAGAITATVWYRHYADARPLKVDTTETAWVHHEPGEKIEHRTAGPYSAAIIFADRGDRQTWTIWVHNTSDVTQTILGLAYSSKHTATPDFITISAHDPDFRSDSFSRPPVTVPPHAYRAVDYTVTVKRCLTPQTQLDWTSLELRVRSGAFTRHETLHFGTEAGAYALEGTAMHCP